jgi:hypothetical protein
VLDGTQSICLSKTGRKQTKYILADQRESTLYSATHVNHPSAIWVRQSVGNYIWLSDLLVKLCKEYTYRYGKVHKCERDGLVKTLYETVPDNNPIAKFTDPPPAMPDECKVPGNSIQSYRNYYIMKKNHFAKWKNRPVPEWYST